MQNKEKNVKKNFFDNLLGAVVHTILCDNKVQPDLFSHAKWDETSFIIHVPVNTCLTGLSMEEQYHQPEGCRDRIKMTWKKNDHHSSEWHLWDSSYFLLLGEWYSFHVIRREKEYGISN